MEWDSLHVAPSVSIPTDERVHAIAAKACLHQGDEVGEATPWSAPKSFDAGPGN